MKKVILYVGVAIVALLGIGLVIMNMKPAKQQVTITANSLECTYDGKEHEVSGFKNESAKGIKIADEKGVTYYVTGITSEAKGKDVKDSKEIKVTGTPVVKGKDGNVVTENFEITIEPGNLTIKPAKLVLKSKTISKQFDGFELKNKDNKLDVETGWVKGEGATYKFDAKIKEVGSVDNTFEITPNKGTNLDNYEIEKTVGKLTIKEVDKRVEVSVKAKKYEGTYDGKRHDVNGFENQDANGAIVIKQGDNTYYLTGISSKASGKDVADSKDKIEITGTPVIKTKDGTDVTSIFKINYQYGSLKIKKADVTLESATVTKDWDGKELTNGDHKITEKGWASGEGATYIFTGVQKDVGSSTNSFTYSLKSGTKEGNYNIKKKEGKLIINDKRYSVTVEAKSYTFDYDGSEHHVDGTPDMCKNFTNQVDGQGNIVVSADGKTFYIKGLSTTYVSGTEAGTQTISITGTPTVVTEDGTDYTNRVSVATLDGTFTINKAKVYLKSASATKDDDGTPLTCNSMEVNSGWIGDDGVEIAFNNAQKGIGSCENTFTYAPRGNTNLSNYDIRVENGILTINKSQTPDPDPQPDPEPVEK